MGYTFQYIFYLSEFSQKVIIYQNLTFQFSQWYNLKCWAFIFVIFIESICHETKIYWQWLNTFENKTMINVIYKVDASIL